MKRIKPSFVTFAILVITTAVALTVSPSARAEIRNFIWPSADAAAVPIKGSDPSRRLGTTESASDVFHFLEPIAPKGGDPQKFDPSLLNYLKVEICQVGPSDCTIIKTFTSQGPASDQIKIATTGGYGSFYAVNWDTSKSNFSNRRTYRVTVFVTDLLLGSIDLTPDKFASFGRTWPIKFLIEKDPSIRVHAMRLLGKSCSQVASVLKMEYGLTAEQIRLLLSSDEIPCSPDDINVAINGVFQDVIIPATTKVSDEATRNVLGSFDPTSGKMIFLSETPLLKNLKTGDVLVSEPGPNAPFGYLRRVTSIQRSKGVYTLGTVQAKLVEAISQGTLQMSGVLRRSSSSSASERTARTMERSNAIEGTFDEGDQLIVDENIDETINLDGGDDELGGTGTVKVTGHVYVKAGYNIGAGIETCATPPFVCVDRLETWMGFEQKSNLRITGTFDGKVHKERIVHPIPMEPIVFFIGFVPVVLVPQLNVIVGVHGEAHIDFHFAADAESNVKAYLKWTEDDGWRDLSTFDPLKRTFIDAGINGTIRMEAYGKLDAALLLYGAIGPSMNGSLGIGGTAQTGAKPFWTIFGHAKSNIGLRSLFTDLFDIGAPQEALLDKTFLIKEAENQPPVFSNIRDGAIQARVNKSVFVGPDAGLAGKNYDVDDPEGDVPDLSVSAPGGIVNGLNVTYSTPGLKTVKITARDSEGLTQDLYLGIDVRNLPPTVTITPASGEVKATVQYWLSASAYDPEDGTLRCSRLTWSATGAYTKTVSSSTRSCGAVFKFGNPGIHTVTVTATDSLGAAISKDHTVVVFDPPETPLPEIEPDSFSVQAISRIRRRSDNPAELGCLPGQLCEVEDGDLIFNGYGGDFIPPLIMRLNASDPSGGPVVVQWQCQTGENFAPVTVNADGSSSCMPIYSPTDPIKVYAYVFTPPPPGGEGPGPAVPSIVRTYYMLQAPN